MGLVMFLLMWSALSLAATAAWAVHRHRVKRDQVRAQEQLAAAWSRNAPEVSP